MITTVKDLIWTSPRHYLAFVLFGYQNGPRSHFNDWMARNKLYAFKISAEKAVGAQFPDVDASKRFKEVRAKAKKEKPEITNEGIKKLFEKRNYQIEFVVAKSEWIINPNSQSRLAMTLTLGDLKSMNPKLVANLLANVSLHGAGNIGFIGWDWFNGVPLG